MPEKQYTVSDGRLTLHLQPDGEGGYLVRSPIDPELLTHATTVPEAFTMARDALKALRDSRVKLVRELRRVSA
jgi:predicted RNase H-like HicB family nuclease